jgi:hypothetical protein
MPWTVEKHLCSLQQKHDVIMPGKTKPFGSAGFPVFLFEAPLS